MKSLFLISALGIPMQISFGAAGQPPAIQANSAVREPVPPHPRPITKVQDILEREAEKGQRIKEERNSGLTEEENASLHIARQAAIIKELAEDYEKKLQDKNGSATMNDTNEDHYSLDKSGVKNAASPRSYRNIVLGNFLFDVNSVLIDLVGKFLETTFINWANGVREESIKNRERFSENAPYMNEKNENDSANYLAIEKACHSKLLFLLKRSDWLLKGDEWDPSFHQIHDAHENPKIKNMMSKIDDTVRLIHYKNSAAEILRSAANGELSEAAFIKGVNLYLLSYFFCKLSEKMKNQMIKLIDNLEEWPRDIANDRNVCKLMMNSLHEDCPEIWNEINECHNTKIYIDPNHQKENDPQISINDVMKDYFDENLEYAKA